MFTYKNNNLLIISDNNYDLSSIVNYVSITTLFLYSHSLLGRVQRPFVCRRLSLASQHRSFTTKQKSERGEAGL